MNALLFGRSSSGHVQSLEENIHNSARVQQVGATAEHASCARQRRDAAQIGPRHGDQGGAAVRQRENQLLCSLAMHLPQHPEGLPVQRVLLAHDLHMWFWVLDVGSLSYSSSITSRGDYCGK